MKKIENIDIYRIANGLVKQHGADATIHAAMLVDDSTVGTQENQLWGCPESL